LRSSLVLGGFLFSALLVVIAVAVIGGTRPALTAVVLCGLTRVVFFAPPFTGGVDMQANPVSLAAFTIVGAGVAILIGELAQLAEELCRRLRAYCCGRPRRRFPLGGRGTDHRPRPPLGSGDRLQGR
jgi:hypothetical protein